MKNCIFISLFILAFWKLSFAQDVATDFTALDCNGEMHHLFSELDAGKVVIIAWVMPCAACIPDPAHAFSLSETYQLSHPDKVLFYMADDYADTNCSTLQSWAANFGMGKSIIFSNADIKMSDYGEDGMPKIVVLGGGGEHKVYYNKNFTSEGIEEAIEYAIAQSTAVGIHEIKAITSIEVFPNPARKLLNIQIELKESADLSFQVLNVSGEQVLFYSSEDYQIGKINKALDISVLSNGTYFLKLNSGQSSKIIKFNVLN